MKVFVAKQIKQIDADTLQEQKLSSMELMERAAQACTDFIHTHFKDDSAFTIVCGEGNNGGDGLAIARQLRTLGKVVEVVLISYHHRASEDRQLMLQKLEAMPGIQIQVIHSAEQLDLLNSHPSIIIDALLGIGLNRPCEGLLKAVIDWMNGAQTQVLSIDIPSGMPADFPLGNFPAVKANITLTFQFPKLSFLFPSSCSHVPVFHIIDIGLSERAIDQSLTPFYYTVQQDILAFLSPRPKQAHKGNFGHALLLAGSKGKSGAALIAARASLRSGLGMLTVRTTADTAMALNIALPEAMTEIVEGACIDSIEKSERFNAIGVGPGIGIGEGSTQLIKQLINYYRGKMVVDADAINVLAENKTWLTYLPPHTILTPHLKEFSRLVDGNFLELDDFEKLESVIQFAKKYSCIVILKGVYTAVVMPDGHVHFNSTGNAGLAKGGSGDTLTGIITGLLGRGYNSPQSALLGVYLHGAAADEAVKRTGEESLLATEVAESIPFVLHHLMSFLSESDGFK